MDKLKIRVVVSLILIITGIILMIHFISLGVSADYWQRRGGFMLGFIITIVGGAIIWPLAKK